MPSAAEALNSKPPLGAQLAAGVRTLSADQQISFSLYQKYVFPLDGMVYWIRIPSSQGSVTTPGIQVNPGLASQTDDGGAAIQVSPGGVGASDIIGGTIYNPADAADQGLDTAESLFVDFTGPAYSHVTGTTVELLPGESIDIPSTCVAGAWVCSPSDNHQFTCILQTSIDSVTLPTDLNVMGSFHYNSEVQQLEDAVFDSNTVIFTSLSEIQPFNNLGPSHMYIAHYRNITFAFSSRGRLYEQADLYHYVGSALKTRTQTQIVEDITGFNPSLVVSNSLPIWLNMPNYVPPYPGFVCEFPLFPSFLVTDNLQPPFGSVHILDTVTMVMGTQYGPKMESDQLCREKVRIHMYGVNNQMASDFVSFVEQYSKDWMNLGLVDTPAIKDGKMPSPEFKVIAQYKTVEFDINYRQVESRNMARQLILHAIVQNQAKWLMDTGETNATDQRVS
jgi:hypothetical protein